MSIYFVIHVWILFVTTECAAELLVCIVVLGCGHPILMSAIICGMDLQALIYIAPIYASNDDVSTALIIWTMFNTTLLFIGVL